MIEDKKQFEKEIIQLFQNELMISENNFKARNIKFKSTELEIVKKNNEDYTSEVRIYFLKNDEIIGVIEFFIFYDGHPEATKTEFRKWFIEEIDHILKKGN
ncbi:MAG: hypothetical protein K1060chlam4_00206 [Candidatus Anoxychlamydiales bacterium]|nr:hypothetical protein [Candidatus Anoxychlamydiales bacterium]